MVLQSITRQSRVASQEDFRVFGVFPGSLFRRRSTSSGRAWPAKFWSSRLKRLILTHSRALAESAYIDIADWQD